MHEKLKSLTNQLDGSKRFLNMVIHDMRNPTTSIKMGLENTCNTLHQLNLLNKSHIELEKHCKNIQDNLLAKKYNQ